MLRPARVTRGPEPDLQKPATALYVRGGYTENADLTGPGGRVARVWRPGRVMDRLGGEGPQGVAWRVGRGVRLAGARYARHAPMFAWRLHVRSARGRQAETRGSVPAVRAWHVVQMARGEPCLRVARGGGFLSNSQRKEVMSDESRRYYGYPVRQVRV